MRSLFTKTPTGFIDSENSNGFLKEDMWRYIFRKEGVAGLQGIRNVRGSRYQQRIGTKRCFERLFYE